jgi:hypothetical protein
MAEYRTSRIRRAGKPIIVGLGAVAIQLAMTVGAGTAVADDLVPNPSMAGSGRAAGSAAPKSTTQDVVRTSGMGEALGPAGTGKVRGSDEAVPKTKAWVFAGAAGDLSACVYDGPWCANWFAIPFDLNHPK